jgi:hypothetical protein
MWSTCTGWPRLESTGSGPSCWSQEACKQTLYNADSCVVVSFDLPADDGGAPTRPQRSGFEIVDKRAQRDRHRGCAGRALQVSGVQALVAGQQSGDAHGLQDRIDAFIAGDTALAQQPVLID